MNMLLAIANPVGFILYSLFKNCFRFATGNPHVIQQFNEVVQELAGGPSRSYLMEAIGFETAKGDVDFIDGISPAKTAGSTTALASVVGREEYDAIGAGATLANFVDYMVTPNDTVTKQRTAVSPYQIRVSKWFKETERNFVELTDPTSRTLRSLMSGFWYRKEKRIVNALLSGTMPRRTSDNTTQHNVTIPDSQILDPLTYDTLTRDVFTDIKSRFLSQYVMDETIFAGFGPTAWRHLVRNSGKELLNQDYVQGYQYFSGGKLPTVDGVTPIVHPIFEDTAALTELGLLADGMLGGISAWTRMGLSWAEFSAMDTQFDENMPAFNGQSVARIVSYGDAVRADDLLVVQGKIVAAE